MGRILALDYGQRRVGAALTDPLKMTAQPLTTWKNKSRDALIQQIAECVSEYDVERIVIGLPLTLRGERGKTAQKVEQFSACLACEVSVPIQVWDERFTSVQAHRIMHEMAIKPSQNKGKIDRMASVLLLQNYLTFLENDASKGA